MDYSREISPAEPGAGTEQYFRWGISALACVQLALRAAEFGGTPWRILDLPSGYGRVLRMLRGAYPDAEIHACDANAEAVEFCAKSFGAGPIVSTLAPGKIELFRRYDLIWAGSLLTRLDEPGWHGFLQVFADHLYDEGVVVFATLGRAFAADLEGDERNDLARDPKTILNAYREHGFAFQDSDLGTGPRLALTRPAWVCSALEQHPDLELVAFAEDGWNGRRDMVACRRKGRGRGGGGPATLPQQAAAVASAAESGAAETGAA